MGIPLYYKSIINEFNDIVIPHSSYKKNANILLLDLNCAIHPCCANKTDENEMFQSILSKIKECIHISNVKDLVYIAIDGPAPRTKMEQQRKRRLLSYQQNKIWDTNQITPGTPFMNKLNQFLKDNIKKIKIKCILSDSNEPGEGEHKIMDFIDNNINKNDTCIVYGLDADLIMLSMIRSHNILLLRERTTFNIEYINDPYVFLDINHLKYCLLSKIKIDHYEINDTTLLHDYLFLCFFIGNDFIIHLPNINIRYNGLDILLNTYKSLQDELFGRFFLTDINGINLFNLTLFFKELKKNENKLNEKLLKNRQKKSQFFKKKYKNKLKNISSFDELLSKNIIDLNLSQKELDELLNISPLLFIDNEKNIFKNKKLYYTNYLYGSKTYNPSFDSLLKKDIPILCQEYIKSIQWTHSYYFNKCPSWRWYYKYNISPFPSDIYTFLINNITNTFTFKKDKPFAPNEQLSIVLPLQKNNFMYPYKSPLHSLFKTYLWECEPCLPHI